MGVRQMTGSAYLFSTHTRGLQNIHGKMELRDKFILLSWIFKHMYNFAIILKFHKLFKDVLIGNLFAFMLSITFLALILR